MNTLIKSSLTVLLSAALFACGGGGGGGPLASGGISGTGSGTITAFGSIVLNDIGRYQTTNAQVDIDDSSEIEDQSDLKLGMVVNVEMSELEDDSNGFRTGDADSIQVSHEIKGPITSVSPLQVLGQTLIVTADTVVQDSSQNGQDPAQTIAIGSLTVGDEVEISGRRDDKGIIQASRIELKVAGVDDLTEWKVVGPVSSLSGSSFNIAQQPINIGAVVPQDCGSGLVDGLRVEIKATPQDPFNPGDTLTTVSEVECKPDRLNFTGDGTIEGEFEGFVTAVSLATNRLTLGGQPVTWNSATLFEGGTLEDLVVGVKLDVRGDFDGTTLAADRIRFRQPRFRIIAPGTLTDSDSVEALGLTIQVTAQTEDDDSLVGSSGSNQIRVRGFIDSSGSLFADEVEDRGAADLADIRLRGPVDEGSVVGQAFDILGITILGATSAPEYYIEDVKVSADTFFNRLTDSSEVDVEDGVYDGIGNTISNAKLEIELED